MRPIPLAAPDGTVYAYACGLCRNVHAGSTQIPRAEVARLAEEYLRAAEKCCVCDCGAPAQRGSWRRLCKACDKKRSAEMKRAAEARRAALAARGVRTCPECYDLRDGCEVCGGTGEVLL